MYQEEMKYGLNRSMSPIKIILPPVMASINFHPLETLEKWIESIDSLDELKTDVVKNEIINIWMLAFRSKESIHFFLSVLINNHGGLIADVCNYYIHVLSQMEIEIEARQ
jgi:hypothetical protein